MAIEQKSEQLKAGGMFALLFVAIAVAFLTCYIYWPGLLSWDAVRQYDEALSDDFDDWHPPIMQWIWQRALTVCPGPAPILLLQTGLYWGGFGLLAGATWRRGKQRLACALLLCGLMPVGIALSAVILKDSLMAGTLLVATGLLALRYSRREPVWAASAWPLIFLAATLRFNAFAACLPLLVAAMPAAWRHSRLRLAITSVAALLALMAAMPIANRLIGARASGVELSLIIFDLGGITYHSNVDTFPSYLAVENPVATNAACYNPIKWDSYSDWVYPQCPLGYTAWKDHYIPGKISLYHAWIHAILTHPVAYAEHRLIHFAINTRIRPLSALVERPVPQQSPPNPWGYRVAPSAMGDFIDRGATSMTQTVVGWPIIWIALALGAFLACRNLPEAGLIAPIALSSLLYGLSYLVFSVAAEIRYHLWTGLGATISIVLVLGSIQHGDKRRYALALTPAFAAALLCTATRVWY